MNEKSPELTSSLSPAELEQIDVFRSGILRTDYPGYPPFGDRMYLHPTYFEYSSNGLLFLRDGPWAMNSNATHPGENLVPDKAEQDKFVADGLQIDTCGRPIHPWFTEMVTDPNIGVLTGKGAYWHWGPNRTVDPIVVQNGDVLLVKRGDNGDWALPGGYIEPGEKAYRAGPRECKEETSLVLPPYLEPQVVYTGPVADVRTTANAWPETTALLYKLPAGMSREIKKSEDGETLDVQWVPLEVALKSRLFGSHQFLISEAVKQLRL